MSFNGGSIGQENGQNNQAYNAKKSFDLDWLHD